MISIDVDDAPTDLSTFYFNCHLKPTFAYETFFNGINGKNSYRLVYVFKERINSRAFVQLYEKICRMTGLSNTKDHCGKVITQLMNGTHHNARVFHSDLIYSSITDLPVEETEKEQVEMFKGSLIPMDLGIPDIKKIPLSGRVAGVPSRNARRTSTVILSGFYSHHRAILSSIASSL